MFPLLILILASGASAVKLECTYWSTKGNPLNCEITNSTVLKGEAIEYLYLNVNAIQLSFSYCNFSVIPANLFTNYSKIERMDIYNSGLKILSPGE